MVKLPAVAGTIRVQFPVGTRTKIAAVSVRCLRNFCLDSLSGIERERGRENGSFPEAEHMNRWVYGSSDIMSERREIPGGHPVK